MDHSPLDDPDDLDNHHPGCPGGCGELADECMCVWRPALVGNGLIDGRDPATIEHLCAKSPFGHEIVDGTVEDCCIDIWRDAGAEP